MAHGIEHPKYYLLPVTLPHPPLYTLNDLQELDGVLASSQYPIAIGPANDRIVQQKFTKLLQVRNETNEHQEIKRWVQNTQSEWIGLGSWVQKFVAGEIAWNDYQVLLNNYNRCKKMLKIAPAGETAAEAVARLNLRRECKKAIRVHEDHIQDEALLRLDEMGQEIEQAAVQKRSQKHIETLRAQHEALRSYGRGREPTNDFPIQRVDEAGPEGLFYAQMDNHARVHFWISRWNVDVFISWLWKFSDVLQFKKNWDDQSVNEMFRDRFVYLADVVFQYIIIPRALDASCRYLSTISVLRTSVNFPDTKADAYYLFLNANNVLWPPGSAGPVPGDFSTLWVEGNAQRVTRKKKRGRREFEEEGLEGIGGAI